MFEYIDKEYIKNNNFKKTGLEHEEQERKSYRLSESQIKKIGACITVEEAEELFVLFGYALDPENNLVDAIVIDNNIKSDIL